MASLSPKVRFAIIGAITFLFIIAGFALVSYHTQLRCKGTQNNVTSTECNDEIRDWCPPAYGYTVSSGSVTWALRCPWKPETAALGILGCIAALADFGITIVLLRRQGKKLRIAKFISLMLTLVLLIISFILMIRDISKAYSYKNEHTGSVVEGFRPASYIANMALFIIAMVSICAYTIYGHKRLGPQKETSSQVKQPPPKPEAVYEPHVPKQENPAPEIRI